MKKRKTTYQQIRATKYLKKILPLHQQKELTKENSPEKDDLIANIEKQLTNVPLRGEEAIDNVIGYVEFYNTKLNTSRYITARIDDEYYKGYSITNGKLDAKSHVIPVKLLRNNDAIKINFQFKSQPLKNKIMPKRKTTAQQIQATTYVKKLMPKHQQKVLISQNSKELDSVIQRLEKELSEIPKQQQGDSIKKSKIFARYFYAESDWFITDIILESNLLFGFVILNGDDQMAEAGYISIDELVNNGKVELDFYFKRDILENILYKVNPEYYPNPSTDENKNIPKQKHKASIAKIVNTKKVDHFSSEYRLIRRFFNLIKRNKPITFRTIQLLYIAFQNAALDRSVRKSSKNAVLFTKVNEKVIALFDIVNPKKDDATIDFQDKSLFNEMEAYVTGKKMNDAIGLLKSFIRLQGYQPEKKKVGNLLKRIESAIDKGKIDKRNRLYDEIIKAKNGLQAYLNAPNDKITPEKIGLSLPYRSVCTNRIKCTGLLKSGKLRKGYIFAKGGAVVEKSKKKVV